MQRHLLDAASPVWAAARREREQLARACFARRGADACAAVYLVAPDSAARHVHAAAPAFVQLAAESARSLKKHLPYALTVLLLGTTDSGGSRAAADAAAVAAACAGRVRQRQRGREGAVAPIIARANATGLASASRAELAAFDHVIEFFNPALTSLTARAGCARTDSAGCHQVQSPYTNRRGWMRGHTAPPA